MALVEANFRNPRLAEILGLPEGQGMIALLEAYLDAVRRTESARGAWLEAVRVEARAQKDSHEIVFPLTQISRTSALVMTVPPGFRRPAACATRGRHRKRVVRPGVAPGR